MNRKESVRGGEGADEGRGWGRLPGAIWQIIPTYAMGQVVYSYDGAWVDENKGECLLSRPESIEALQWLSDWRDKYHIQPTEAEMAGEASWRFQLNAFASNKWGQISENEGSNSVFFVPAMEAGELNYDVAPMPMGPEGRVTEFGGAGVMMFGSTKVPDLTWEVMSEFTLGDTFLREMYILLPECPVAKTALNEYKWLEYDKIPEHREYLWQAPSYAKIAFRSRRFGAEMKDIIWPGLEPMWAGDVSAAEAIAQVCPKVEEKLAELIAEREG